MNEEILKWLQAEDELYINKAYKIIYPTIYTLVRGNQLFRINNFSDEDAEEWTNDIIMILNRVRSRIELKGFFAFTKEVIRKYLITRINKIRNFDGVKIVSVELSDKNIFESYELDDNNIYYKPIDSIKTEPVTSLFNPLNSEIDNGIFQNLRKWILWKNKNSTICNSELIISKTNLSRIGFTTIEPSSYNVYYNPSSLITRYDLWLNHNLNDRDYMWSAIDNMVKSIKEIRNKPKPDPMVGAILVDENGFVIASSYRGKNDPKGHCEYNLLEYDVEPKYVLRKYQVPFGLPGSGAMVTELNLKNATLYVTLEPCTKRSIGKCSCTDRIIYSGIKTVYIGLKDPDSEINGKGIIALEAAGITVKHFHQDLLFEIIRAKNQNDEKQNLQFIISKKEFYLKEQPELFVSNILQV